METNRNRKQQRSESKMEEVKSPTAKKPKTPTYISLDGTWNIENRNRSVSVVGLVPGNVHSALQQAGQIEDPYYRFNDVVYKWISNDSWTYSRSFTLQESLLGNETVRLVCHGLDTVANVSINGVLVGSSDNQFVGYVFDITGLLQEGENTIKVEFQSAVDYAQRAFDSHPYLIPPTCPPADYHPECHANFIRKAQCSFSWDWGPAFPTQGIWRSIGIEIFDIVSIRSVGPKPIKDDSGGWLLNVTVEFDIANSLESVSGKLLLSVPEVSSLIEIPLTLTHENIVAVVIFPVGQVDAWWPRGYGEAKLYDLEVIFTPDGYSTDAAASSTLRTGFRTIELVEDPVESGLSFYFRINDIPIFMKGSNWIPMDSFQDRITYDKLRNLLLSAVDVNMNSIRIWGGGIYESDDFYDIADELGILVWQDMMFACSMYPVHQTFLASVEDEIRYQVKRIGRHPSVIAWTANNENEGALVDNWYGTSGPNYEQYKSDYVQLYIDVVMETILKEDSSRPFLSSSPSNGQVTEENGWISESPRPGVPEYGDVHFYNYVDDCLSLAIYPRARYSSEYGYQSWPSYNTLKAISDPVEDLFYGTDFFHHREHHAGALNGTESSLRRHFLWPETGDKEKDFQSYIYLTQVTQAVCYQAQTEFYRRSRSDPSVGTMGALYWQHNDIWQAPSWATIDYDGQWKMAHHFAARFFADPMLSFIEEETNFISIYAISDSLTAIPGVQLVVRLWTWSNFTALKEWTTTVDVPAEGSQKVWEKKRSDVLVEGQCNSEDECFLTAFLRNDSQQLTYSNAFYFVPWKLINGTSDPGIEVTGVTSLDGSIRSFSVQLTASSVSLFTWLEAVDISGHFSDNGFLMTEPSIVLEFYAWQDDVDPEALRSSIVITTLHSIYN